MIRSSSSSGPQRRPGCKLPIPKNYSFLQVLGMGSFGVVVKCMKEKTKEMVAIKVNIHDISTLRKEAHMMRAIMARDLDNANIVTLRGELFERGEQSLVFEMLDISLQNYIEDLQKLMRLEDIRSIIQQVAVALDALKRENIIHCDLKLDNIMMVDRTRRPFRIKLIDFGLAVFKLEAKIRTIRQPPSMRAPEVMLGLPVSEAIDVWSLGCLLGILVFGVRLFPARDVFDELRYITELRGLPPEHLLRNGSESHLFFNKTPRDSWQLKKPDGRFSFDTRTYPFRSLDEMKTVCLEKNNPTEAADRWECVELLKAMLRWDPMERISPSGILNHPFITKSYLSSSRYASWTEEDLPPGLIQVPPADPVNRIHLLDGSEVDAELRPEQSVDGVSSDADGELPPAASDAHEKKEEKKRNTGTGDIVYWMRKKLLFGCCNDVEID